MATTLLERPELKEEIQGYDPVMEEWSEFARAWDDKKEFLNVLAASLKLVYYYKTLPEELHLFGRVNRDGHLGEIPRPAPTSAQRNLVTNCSSWGGPHF